MTTTTPAGSAGTDPQELKQTAGAVTALLGLVDVIVAVGSAPHTVYQVNETPEVHVSGALQPWLDATGIPAPIIYTPAHGTAMWEHPDGDWRTTSTVGQQGFCLRHVDLSRVEPGA